MSSDVDLRTAAPVGSRRASAMNRPASFSSPDDFALTELESSDLASEPRYLAVANLIVAALCGESGVVLVTGDPPARPHLLSQALRKATRSRPAVIDIACRAELSSEELSCARAAVAALLPSGGAIDGAEGSPTAPPLFVFSEVDQLSDLQIREFFTATAHPGREETAAVLLARSAFLARLEEPSLRFLKARLAAQFGFQQVRQGEPSQDQPAEPDRASGTLRGAFRGLAASVVLVSTVAVVSSSLRYYQPIGQPSARPNAGAISPLEAAASTASLLPAAEPSVAASLSSPAATPRQTERLTQEASPPNPIGPTPGLAAPRVGSSAAAIDPGQPERRPGAASPASPPPSAPLAAQQRKLSPTVEATATEHQRLPEPTLPVVPPAQDPLQNAPKATPAEAAALVKRGDEFLGAGDITSARLFYERAAEAGNGSAALRLGATFDPSFLGRPGIRGIPGSWVQAVLWYRRADELGEPAASERLNALERQGAAQPGSPIH